MGHHGKIKQEYRQLADRLQVGSVGFPEPEQQQAWRAWRDIMEILYTPEEAALLAHIPVKPSSLSQLSRRMKISAAELKPKLEFMCHKGLVMDLVNPRTGRTKYLLSPPVVGFFEFSLMRAHDSIPKKRMAEALEAYTHYDDSFAREVFGSDTVVGRTLVNEAAPSDDIPDVLDWERATSVISSARVCAVSLCYCRHKAEHLNTTCDAPQDVCLSLNGGADFVIRREFGRQIETAEALDILVQCREQNLVQIADNVQHRPAYICNCCGCCCGQLQAINQYDLAGVNPSGFLPEVSADLCNGCGKCVKSCPIDAIKIEKLESAKPALPTVDPDRCIGCGVCAGACPASGIKMANTGSRRIVPVNAIDRSIRMVIERGKLGQFIFDEGAGRGHRFMNQVCQALNKLPGAQKILASEQVTSLFLKAALGQVSPGFKKSL